MDRVKEKQRWSFGRILPLVAVGALVVALGTMVYSRSGVSRLTVESARLSTATVSKGEFSEYYPFDGTVVPEVSVFLDLEEGGQVEEIHTQGGQWVEKGSPILRISNTSLQRTTIDTETQLLENLDNISSTQIKLAQDSLILKDQLLDMDYRILELQKKFDRYEQLAKTENNPLTIEEYEQVRDELDYQKSKRALLVERITQEEILASRQLAMADNSIERLNKSLELLNELVESLEVKAPIAGHLSNINAQIGQNIQSGTRVGQIDLLDDFKLRVKVDQYYAADIVAGTQGRFRLDGTDFPVEVSKIYPEVVEGAFYVDAQFVGAVPGNIRRGQTLTVELVWGAPQEALMVRRGSFYQQTSGRWAYLVSEDGRTASRVDIRLGRQNPQFVEVLEGLREGDRIITSGYESFNAMELLEFTEAIR